MATWIIDITIAIHFGQLQLPLANDIYSLNPRLINHSDNKDYRIFYLGSHQRFASFAYFNIR